MLSLDSLLPRSIIGVAFVMLAAAGTAAADRPNVLFIAIDDLNDWIGPLAGHPQVKTPAMDRLAKRGTTFLNAHCQSPLCNPSRTSLLTGLRPSTTGVYGLAPWFRTLGKWRDHVTLPQHFGRNGYHTLTTGKIYHQSSQPKPIGSAPEFAIWGLPGRMSRPEQKFVMTPDNHPLVDWGIFPERDEECFDWDVADWAIDRLKGSPKQPFFLCVGFRHPHVPCYTPRKWFDLYADDNSILPPVQAGDRSDTPEFSWYLHWKLPEPRLSWLRKEEQWRPLVRAYLASISFVDSQVGRLLDALDGNGLTDNTIIVLWSDHGWHLGEKGITGKNTLWERSTRVPLIFAGPGITANARCTRSVELLDLYPTLVELCGLPTREGLDGHSLAPLLQDALGSRQWPAITTHNPNNHGVRSERWRYIQYADGSRELYDRETDPNEWTNLAGDPRYAPVIAEHRRWLPVVNEPLAPGSMHRTLSYDNGVAVWEGKPINPTEKEE